MYTIEKLHSFYKEHNEGVRKLTNQHRQERAKLIKMEKRNQGQKRKYAPDDLKFDNDWARLYKKHLNEDEEFQKKYALKIKIAAAMEKCISIKDKFRSQ